ncbi:hypothetical protein ACFQE8_21815 [Salinirubellus sp. GCM10025818]|uniref:hypothetical protein n=1 Tax=Salinirubellus TaxID=2162630 RepID=UPI0030D37845
MSRSGSGVGAAMSGYVRQVGRGLVYLLILQYSVGIAVRFVVERAVGPTSISTPGVVSTLVVAAVAGVLVNSSNPPTYRRLTGFTLVSLAVGFVADALIGVGDGYVGALYPTLQAVLVWLGAFLLAYAVAFEIKWSRAVSSVEETDSE